MNRDIPKVAVVTAGAKRLGKVICLKLAELGYDIALHFNKSYQEARSTSQEIKELGRHCELFQANLLDSRAVFQLIPDIFQTMDSLSLLVNNASLWQPISFLKSQPEQLRENWQIHVEAPYYLSQAFALHAKQGQIINILDSAIAGWKTSFFPYLLSKKALYDLTMLCATELAPKIRVNALAPGMILQSESKVQEYFKKQLTDNLLQKAGSPQAIAAGIEYLIRNEHVTGECLYIDAGEHLSL